MSMKKKFLALALAGAVAMPVVANATNTKTESGSDARPLDTSVEIQGSVLSDNGVAAAGKIQVELPTAMVFTVDKNGGFDTANNYTITNQSKKAINIQVTGFSEQYRDGGIKIDDYATIESAPQNSSRSTVGIRLNGNNNHVVNLKEGMSPASLFTNIASGATEQMVLEGIAGTKAGSAPNGVAENFTVQFRITAI